MIRSSTAFLPPSVRELHWLPIGKRMTVQDRCTLMRHFIVDEAARVSDGTLLSSELVLWYDRVCALPRRGDLNVPRFRLRSYSYRAFAVTVPHDWTLYKSTEMLTIRQDVTVMLTSSEKARPTKIRAFKFSTHFEFEHYWQNA